jgi:hypothetical protein
VRTVEHVELQLDSGKPVPQFRLLSAEGFLIDLIIDPQVQQAVLLCHQERLLALQLAATSD